MLSSKAASRMGYPAGWDSRNPRSENPDRGHPPLRVSRISGAMGVVVQAKGMAQIAGQTGLSREQLYRSFRLKGNPTLKTTLAVMRAVGVQLTTKTDAAACGERESQFQPGPGECGHPPKGMIVLFGGEFVDDST